MPAGTTVLPPTPRMNDLGTIPHKARALQFEIEGTVTRRTISLTCISMNEAENAFKEVFYDPETKLWGNKPQSGSGRTRILKFGEPDLKIIESGEMKGILTVLDQADKSELQSVVRSLIGAVVEMETDLWGEQAALRSTAKDAGTAHADGSVTAAPVVQPHKNGAQELAEV